ncbi:MAG: hypothetical protein JJU05_04045 [Verrucomicrobia bacterium]|nr:hypothetical protein [Verrucomicrobiota bacterium]
MMAYTNEIVGMMLVRNDDRFVSVALRNMLAFVDRVYVLDHGSTDDTRKRVEQVASRFPDKVHVQRIVRL